ncbi:hypothetical protein VTL71DRAFT_7275 [Oculimacula yallundae]|uniref:Uncharacterized protein n=1 Tax=Oculimacula yallundae TaxID=86028 RepID=A0ABR4BW79_9HELO
MSRKQIIKGAASVVCVAVGIALSNSIMRPASALPTVRSTALFEPAPGDFGTYLYPSRVAATIFGVDATEFDYHLASDSTAATEALAAYSAAYTSGEESRILVTFLNVTGAGTLTESQATDLKFLCGELSGDMATQVSSCVAMSPRAASK